MYDHYLWTKAQENIRIALGLHPPHIVFWMWHREWAPAGARDYRILRAKLDLKACQAAAATMRTQEDNLVRLFDETGDAEFRRKAEKLRKHREGALTRELRLRHLALGFLREKPRSLVAPRGSFTGRRRVWYLVPSGEILSYAYLATMNCSMVDTEHGLHADNISGHVTTSLNSTKFFVRALDSWLRET
jgi:hypothetical protein